MATGSRLARTFRRQIFSLSNGRTPRRPFFPSTMVFFSGSPGTQEEEEDPGSSDGDLRARIFRLRFPKRSATVALERWVAEGGSATAAELRRITRELRGAQRFKHALETCEWMLTHRKEELEVCDYADRIDLITKVFGVGVAEEFFEGLPLTAKKSETYSALLHAFAQAKRIDKAEDLFERMKNSILTLTALPYNEMMTLYISAGHLDKVFMVIEELKAQNVSPDLFTYNLWVSACAATMDVDGVRKILDEMSVDSNFDDRWRIYKVLTEIYITASQLVSSENSLIESAEKLSQRDWITYDFLVILHSGLGNKERIGEIWKALKMTSQKMSSRNYICILSSYLVMGNLKEAEEIIDQWRQSNSPNFNISSCNKLFDALVSVGLNSTAETFHQLMIQKDCKLTNCTSVEDKEFPVKPSDSTDTPS